MNQTKFTVLSAAELDQVYGGCNDTNNADAINVPSVAGFVNTWHGLGCDHQTDETGTAAERHGFAGAAAGGSGVNPTGNSVLAA